MILDRNLSSSGWCTEQNILNPRPGSFIYPALDLKFHANLSDQIHVVSCMSQPTPSANDVNSFRLRDAESETQSGRVLADYWPDFAKTPTRGRDESGMFR